MLELLASRSAEAFQAYQRLIEVNYENGNWDGVIANAARGLAINPFTERIHYCSGCAHEAKAEPALAVKSFENSLRLDPANPSEVRFRLARNLKGSDPAKAKRHLLDALADSPRYREAHGMLLEVVEGRVPAPTPVDPTPTDAGLQGAGPPRPPGCARFDSRTEARHPRQPGRGRPRSLSAKRPSCEALQ